MSDWLQGYKFALRNLSDEAVQADLSRVRAEPDIVTQGVGSPIGQPRTVRESGAPNSTPPGMVHVVVCADHKWCANATDEQHANNLRVMFDSAPTERAGCAPHGVELWPEDAAADANNLDQPDSKGCSRPGGDRG